MPFPEKRFRIRGGIVEFQTPSVPVDQERDGSAFENLHIPGDIRQHKPGRIRGMAENPQERSGIDFKRIDMNRSALSVFSVMLK